MVLIRRVKHHVIGLDLGNGLLGENATLGNAWTRQCRNKFSSKSLWSPPMPPTAWDDSVLAVPDSVTLRARGIYVAVAKAKYDIFSMAFPGKILDVGD